jgi:lysophospholipase L1-like esterase
VTVVRPSRSRRAVIGATLVACVALAGCASTADRLVAQTTLVASTASQAPAVSDGPAATDPGALSDGPPATAQASSAATDPPAGAVRGGPVRLVTIGDTYTSGYPLGPQYSWPAQLVRALEPEIALTLAGNLAAQGQTSANVIAEQLWELPGRRPQIVTIQVGANDVISPDIDLDDYRVNIATILDRLLDTVPASRIFAISTPDFTLTPHGGDFGTREAVRDEIREANAILADEAELRSIPFIEIAPVSDRVGEDPTLVGGDGLYPSAKQYAGWVELIAPRIRAALSDLSR